MNVSVSRVHDGRYRVRFVRDDGRENNVYVEEDDILAISDTFGRIADRIIQERTECLISNLERIASSNVRRKPKPYDRLVRRLAEMLDVQERPRNGGGVKQQ